MRAIGLEENHAGVVDLRNEAVTFHGPNGNDIKIEPVPENMKALRGEAQELIEAVWTPTTSPASFS